MRELEKENCAYVLNCILYNQRLTNIDEINLLCEEERYHQFCFKRIQELGELTTHRQLVAELGNGPSLIKSHCNA